MTNQPFRARPAAVSATRAHARTPFPEAEETHPASKSGSYRGMTEEPIPRRVSFRVVRGGVRDLLIGGVPMADWLRIGNGKAQGLTRDGSAIALRWGDHGSSRGWLTTGDPGAPPLRFRASPANR